MKLIRRRREHVTIALFGTILAVGCIFGPVSACAAAKKSHYWGLTKEEREFLMMHCPDMNQVVDSGTAVVYGELVTPPMLVTRIRDQIYIEGIQVVPRRARDKDFWANKLAYRMRELFYREHRAGNKDAIAVVREELERDKKRGVVDTFSIDKGKLGLFWRVDVQVGTEAGYTLFNEKSVSGDHINKYDFILSTLFREYRLKTDAGGKDSALAWLKARLDELQKNGMLEIVEWNPEQEIVEVELQGSAGRSGYGFGVMGTPGAIAYKKQWQVAEPQAKVRLSEIVAALKSDRILIFSYRFEKAIPRDEKVLSALRAVDDGRDHDSSLKLLSRRLSISGEDVKSLSEELE